MTSTTFFHELKETYRWTLRKNIGILILLAVLMFLGLPLLLFMTIPGWSTNDRTITEAEQLQRMQNSFLNFMEYAPAAATVLTLIFSAVLCVVLFGYMHKRRSVDLFHSLPVRREALLLGRWLTGCTVLIAPLLLNFLILWITQAAYGIGINGWVIFRPMLFAVLMTLAAFTFCMFMAVCSGTMLDTALSVIGVNAGYPLLILCAFAIINILLPGANLATETNLDILTALAPFAAAFLPAFFAQLSVWFLPWWILITLVTLGGSVLLYDRRKSESAENNFAFPIPKILIRFLLTAVGGMGFGLILGSGNTVNFFIGVVAGSLIAHVVVEGVYSRGFKQLKKSFHWYSVFAVAFLLFYGTVATGFFGYDTRMPSAGEVESVSVETGYHEWNSGSGCNVIYDENGRYLKTLSPVITDPENIDTVLKTHEKIVQMHRTEAFPYQMNNTARGMLTLNYRLKNGKSFTRSFQYFGWNNNSAYAETISAITSMKEYTESTDMAFLLDSTDIKTVDINRLVSDNAGKVVVPDDAKKAELLAALQQDLLEKKINYIPDDAAEKSIDYKSKEPICALTVEFNSNIEPKDSRLKTILGNYTGKINLNGGGTYNIFSKSSAVYALLEQYGW